MASTAFSTVPNAVMMMTGTMRVLAPDDLQHLQTGHAGKLEIGEDEVGAVDQRQRFFGVRRLLDFKAGVQQLKLDDAAQLVFVFDDQYSFFHV